MAAEPAGRRASTGGPGSTGDLLLSKTRVDPAMAGFFDLAEDESWEPWLATVAADAREPVIIAAQALSITYRDKDRDLDTALHWAVIHVRLARSLPDGFGPRSGRMGYGKDHYLYVALAGLARLEGMRGAAEREFALLREAESHYDAEQEARRRDGVTERPVAERILGIGGGPERLYRDLSKAAWRIGDEPEARRYHLLATDHRNDDRTADSEIAELMLKGEYWLDMGEPDRALRCFQDAVRLAETEQIQTHLAQVTANAYRRMADAHRRLGVPRTALAMLAKARDLMAESGKSGFLAGVEVTAAQIYRANPRLGAALDHYLRALAYYSAPAEPVAAHTWTAPDGRLLRVVDFEGGFGVLLDAAEILREDGRRREAAGFLRLATAIAETVRGGALDEASRIAVQEQRGEALVALARIQLELARETGSPDFADEAWQTMETLRARTFLDMVGDAALAAPAGIPAELAARETELLERRRRLRAAPGRDAAFWAAHEAIEGELAQVWRALAEVSPDTAEYVAVRQARPASHAEVSAVLRDQAPGASSRAVAVNLFFRDDETLVLLAVGGGDTHVRVATSRVDRRRLAKFAAANFGSASRVRELAIDLEDLFHHEFAGVVAPLADLCEPGDTLVVGPTGPVHNIPLGAVRLGEDVLLARNPLVISPSASLLRSRRLAVQHGGQGGHAVFGDPTGDLAGARVEAAELAGRWGTGPLLGAEATAGALLAALGSAGSVHVAAHAEFSAADPLASGVRMADRVLTAREILAIRTSGLDLVALSACESGVYHAERSEEPMGLPRALLFAGAHSVLASLWKVPDRSAYQLMTGFYSGLRSGLPKAEALRRTVLTVRGQDERLDRWAGFVLVGSWL
jgi:CHAT domain-containing protein/tetratricopeptide (TPR) repeat protein